MASNIYTLQILSVVYYDKTSLAILQNSFEETSFRNCLKFRMKLQSFERKRKSTRCDFFLRPSFKKNTKWANKNKTNPFQFESAIL